MVKSPEQIKKIRQSAKILAATLRLLKERVAPGVNLKELEEFAREFIENQGGTPAFLGYKPAGAKTAYPAALCTSVNEVVVHGQPHDYVLKEGDILKLDLGVNWQGGISDAAITVPVGKISEKDTKLINTTRDALMAGIQQARAGKSTGDIGHAIETVIEGAGAKVIDGLTGHGVGLEVHEEPSVFNFGEPGEGVKLEEGMVLAIEPMVSLNESRVEQLDDDSYATVDGSNSAHFEHTILITKGSPEILTS